MLLGFVLGLGGGAHRIARLSALAFGVEYPGGCDLPLNIHLFRPIGILGITQLVPQLRELGDVDPGGLRIARTGGSQRARKIRDRLHVR